MLGIQVDLNVEIDSKDLFSTFYTCINATDKSIRGDVSVIRYKFETKKIPGSTNLTDPGTKRNSSLTNSLQLLMFTGEIPIDYTDAISNSSTQFKG